VLSFGGGQDSTAILLSLLRDQSFRDRFAPGHLIIVMSDTGNEHPETYKHVALMSEKCKAVNVPFFFLRYEDGWHYDTWPDLLSFYRRTNTCGSKAFMKSCTDKLKIQPIYKFLTAYVLEHFPTDLKKTGRFGPKQPLVDFAEKHGQINVLIGIAAGEEKRVAKKTGSKWMDTAINRVYPLIEWGWDRDDCQKFIAGSGVEVPIPSNCMCCPYVNEVELLWLHRFYPDMYDQWVEIESNKLTEWWHLGVDKNLGVFGTDTLPEVLERAKKQHGHMTDEELMAYKMTHGHCVASKY
jgi:3'-phosphoadenosine 5'-phosphosulfate sulfotransferase (PAPS reductase)/FAD synthetase